MSDADCVGLGPIDQSTCDACTHSESSKTQSSVAAPPEAVEAVSSSVCHILKQTGKTQQRRKLWRNGGLGVELFASL